VTDFIKVYAQMNDGELVSLAAEADSLTEAARSALWDELRRRGLEAEASAVHEEQRQETELDREPLPPLVTVGDYDDPMKAQLAKVQLEAEGVECFLQDENINRLYGLASIPLGGVKLQAKESDAGRAAEILGLESEIAETAGPRASSTRTSTVVSLVLLWALAVGVIALLVYLFDSSR
jgi:hypothetical protein